MALPEVVSRDEWLAARISLLAREKEHVRARDALNADRRRLPMIKITKDYQFEGPDGMVGLAGLFGASRQLIVQHVMFGPDWEAPCPSCSASLSELATGVLTHLNQRDTNFVLVSRAPYAKIALAQRERGFPFPWYSAYGSDFNFDFEVSFDPAVRTPVYNYRPEPELDAGSEVPGFSCFVRDGASLFHTYSTFARGTEYVGNAYTLLDMTVLGRLEEWEEPKGRAEKPHPADPSFSS